MYSAVEVLQFDGASATGLKPGYDGQPESCPTLGYFSNNISDAPHPHEVIGFLDEAMPARRQNRMHLYPSHGIRNIPHAEHER